MYVSAISIKDGCQNNNHTKKSGFYNNPADNGKRVYQG
jgi:hypothetical protein